ncbi:MAG: GyrI-like domain-containing protein [Lutimonas sp.]
MKKILGILLVALLGFFIWLMFLKPYDFIAVLDAKSVPGTVNHTLKTWSRSIEDSDIRQTGDMNHILQELRFNDSLFLLDWKLSRKNDSLTRVEVGVSLEKKNPFMRILNLFSDTDFKRRSRNTILDFNEILKEHLASFRVSVDGEASLEPTFCAYVTIEDGQFQKALGMMQNYSLLSNVLLENNIELSGMPFVEVTYWDQEKEKLKYNFCYPIVKKDSLPKNGLVSFKQFKGGQYLKATYNGNYISSDRAWYALLDYAKQQGIEIEEKPVEVFFNNPNMGGDELDWRADIYMPMP